MKFLKKAPLLFMLVIFIVGYSLVSVLIADTAFSENENRRLQQFPIVTPSRLTEGDFEKDYETYISDQFFLREFWIKMKAASETVLLKTENNDIVFGKDDYMFRKLYSFDRETLRKNLTAIDAFSAAMKSSVSVMVVPSKYYPLIEYVPEGLPLVDQSFYIGEIYSYLSANTTPVNVKDVLGINNQRYIYYRTDPHWTNYGAWLGYSQFVTNVGLTPFDYSSHSTRSIPDFLGANYSKSQAVTPFPDTIEYFDFEIESLVADDITHDSLYNLAQFDLRDKYSSFIHGNNGYTVIESEKSTDKRDSILIIKDSFANSMIPMLTQHYNTIIAVDPRFYSGSYSQFAEMEFDDILILYSFETLVSDSNIPFIGVEFY